MITKTKTLICFFSLVAVLLVITNSCTKKESTDTTPTNTDPYGMFQYTIKTNGIVSFTNTSTNATSYLWDFGDGNTSTATTVSFDHQYLRNGTYQGIQWLRLYQGGFQNGLEAVNIKRYSLANLVGITYRVKRNNELTATIAHKVSPNAKLFEPDCFI